MLGKDFLLPCMPVVLLLYVVTMNPKATLPIPSALSYLLKGCGHDDIGLCSRKKVMYNACQSQA